MPHQFLSERGARGDHRADLFSCTCDICNALYKLTYLRSGKCLATKNTEVLVQLKPPPQRLFDDSAPVDERANYLRFQLAPNSAVALAARVKRAGKGFIGDQRELYLLDAQASEETPYKP